MQSLRTIETFVQTAELGSFAKAAQELGISAVAVGKNISRLEQSLGVRLFARSTRHLRLTPEGTAFLARCREPLRALEEACRHLSDEGASARGLVRVTAVSPAAHLFVLPGLPDFLARHPGISVDLEVSEVVHQMIPGRFDVGIRVGALDDAHYVARPLGPLRMLTCASPAYLVRHGVPQTSAALAQHRLLGLQLTGTEQPYPWPLAAPGAEGVQLLAVDPVLRCNEFRGLLAACIDGMGIAQLPQPMVLAALRSGQLRQVLPAQVLQSLQIFVHYPSRKQLPVRVRAFVDFVVQGLGNHPDLLADTAAFVAR